MFQYRNEIKCKKIPFRIKAKQTKLNTKPNTMLNNVLRVTLILSTTDFHIHSKQKPKTHFKRFMMGNSNENMGFSVGCVMCASNFTHENDETIVTTCGHLYHKQCLIKWFESQRE